jgi:predicted ATPase
LLQAVAPWDEATVRQALQQLVEAELLYQRGLPPQATYVFKHVLTQDAAYQSLLKRMRQQYHQQIAQVLEAQFPEIVTGQPELLAHHYTEAGLTAQAIPSWQRAGQHAIERSAHAEAIQHLTTGLALLGAQPESSARAQQELDLQLALGSALIATKGVAASEVEQTYARARTLCHQVGETPQLLPALWGLCRFYLNRGVLPLTRELGEQLYQLARREAASLFLLEAHEALGSTLFLQGDYIVARTHLEQGVALTNSTTQRTTVLRHGEAPGVRCLSFAALTLWCLGYPAQAVQRSQASLALAQELAHPYSLAVAWHLAAYLHHRRREASTVQAQAEVLLTLARRQEFPVSIGNGQLWRGWALAMQGQNEVGMTQMHQGMTAVVATGVMGLRILHLVLLAETAGHAGQIQKGLRLLSEALTALEVSGRGDLLAEAYRVQGTLLLNQTPPAVAQAEGCFQQSLAVARRQQARSWELRAATSLAQLWQQHGRSAEAYELLTPIYGWFTEGFDTADLQEAKALLDELAE